MSGSALLFTWTALTGLLAGRRPERIGGDELEGQLQVAILLTMGTDQPVYSRHLLGCPWRIASLRHNS